MVFEWRNDKVGLKKLVALSLVLFLFAPLVDAKPNYTYTIPVKNAVSTTKKAVPDVLQGGVSVDIKPYCKDWDSNYAFNTINHIGAKLISANNIEQKIQFVVSDGDDANASTDINNRISVNKGLLKYVETEDELAFVIGHEMGHITKTHVKKSIARNTTVAAASVAGTAMSVIGIISDSSRLTKSGAILVGSAAAGTLVNKKLSRGQETKSDMASIDYLANAGYNPLASISLLNKISGNYFDFFSDHPSGEKRIRNAYKYIEKKYPQYIEKGYNTTSYTRAMKFVKK